MRDPQNTELKRRRVAAISAMKAAYERSGEDSVNLFIKHHLSEFDSSYWTTHLGSAAPAPLSVLDLMVLQSHWSDEDEDEEGIDNLDFTLPEDVTDYVISVRFDSAGNVESIEIES